MQYKFRYEDGIKSPPGGAMLRGKAAHKGQEMNYLQKLESREDLPLEAVEDFTSDAFEKEKRGTVFGDDKPGDVKEAALRAARIYHQEVAPTRQPWWVERQIKIVIPRIGIPVMGYIDLVHVGLDPVTRETDNHFALSDTKTKVKKPTGDEAKKSMQLPFYAIGWEAENGFPLEEVGLDFAVATKTPYIAERQVLEITPFVKERWIDTVAGVLKAIEAGAYYPSTDGWHCSPKWCGYWKLCEGKGRA